MIGGVVKGASDGTEGEAGGADSGARELGVVWSAPPDRPSDVDAMGTWVVAGAVIRARTDRVVAYDLADGRVMWTYPVPADHRVCADKQKWRVPVAKGCRTYSVTAENDTAALLTACDDRSARLAVVDVASGRERWQAPLRISAEDGKDHDFSGDKTTVVLSVDPVVVHTSDEGGAFLAFDALGKRRVTIPQSQPDLDVAIDEFPTNWIGRPAYPIALLGDVLVVPMRKPGDTHDTAVAGFSLTDGRRLWLTDVHWLLTIGVAADTVVVTAMTDTGDEDLLTLSAKDGTVTGKVGIGALEDVIALQMEAFEVWPVGDRYAFVNADGAAFPPVTVLGPRP